MLIEIHGHEAKSAEFLRTTIFEKAHRLKIVDVSVSIIPSVVMHIGRLPKTFFRVYSGDKNDFSRAHEILKLTIRSEGKPQPKIQCCLINEYLEL